MTRKNLNGVHQAQAVVKQAYPVRLRQVIALLLKLKMLLLNLQVRQVVYQVVLLLQVHQVVQIAAVHLHQATQVHLVQVQVVHADLVLHQVQAHV